MKIGDYLDLEKEKTYPCSDGSATHTVDVDSLVEAVRADERKQIGDYFASELKRRSSLTRLTPKNAEYYVAIDWFEHALERLQKGEAVI